MDLDYIHLVFTVRLEQSPPDPCILFRIKPLFENAFRARAGDEGSTNASICVDAWNEIFSQALSTDAAAIKRFQKPALPFVFHVPVLESRMKGELLEIGLVLLGRAIQFLPHFIRAFKAMLRDPMMRIKIRLFLEKIETTSYTGSRHLLMRKGGALETRLVDSLSLAELSQQHVASDSLGIRFLTPLRLRTEGRDVRQFSFSVFFRSLLRRVSSAVYYSGGGELQHDFKWLAQQSDMVTCRSEELKWETWGSKWSGFIGRISVNGPLAELSQYLMAGALLGVGKGATYGLGRYCIEP